MISFFFNKQQIDLSLASKQRKIKQLVFFSLIWSLGWSQKKDTTQVNQLNEVLVNSTRVNLKMPFTFSNLKKADFEKRNLGQDLPILIQFLDRKSVV